MPRPFEMRRPEDVPPSQQTVHVPPKVVIGIVNQIDQTSHARVSSTVIDRFTGIAEEHGWKAVLFTKDAQTRNSAGATLLNPYSDLTLPANKSGRKLQIK